MAGHHVGYLGPGEGGYFMMFKLSSKDVYVDEPFGKLTVTSGTDIETWNCELG